ncbi:MAG: hypothetical protein WHT28_09090, partial [Fimbriimonadales bacterium]
MSRDVLAQARRCGCVSSLCVAGGALTKASPLDWEVRLAQALVQVTETIKLILGVGEPLIGRL